MKKIVALALSLVMALALCTTAFAAVPLWTLANANTKFDAYSYDNQIVAEDLTIEYVAPVAPEKGANGIGNIAFYWIKDANGAAYGQTGYVVVDKWVEGCVALKMANAEVEAAEKQTTPEAVYYMQPISAAYYIVSGEKFADWGTKCGQYADPKDGATYVKYTYNKNEIVQDLLETATDAQPAANILVDGKVYTMGSKVLTKLAHDWVAQLNKEGKIATFKCSRCGVVATVVDSSFNAPKDAKLIKVGELLAYYYEDGKAAGNGTSSPKTFDAGIAMYVGMSLMSVAGSAVVIGKKKEF